MTETILRIIGEHNSDDRITSRTLEGKTSLCGADIRSIIHGLRLSHHPIAGEGDGYFMARDKFELGHTIASLRSRGSKIFEVANALEDCFKNEELNLWNG